MSQTDQLSPRPLITWPRHWDAPWMPSTKADAIKMVKRCLTRRTQMKAALREAYVRRGRRWAKRQARRYMHSLSARVAVLAKSYFRDGRQLTEAQGDVWFGLFTEVHEVNAWREPDEKGVAFPVERTTGRPRYVYAFGTVHYACSWLAKDVLDALEDTCPTQFMTNGGEPKLRLWLQQTLPAAELVVTTDIPSCFEKLRREALDDGLPLPRKVMKETLYDPKDHAVFLTPAPSLELVPMPKELVATVSSPKRGVAQGAAAASVAAEVVIGSVIKALDGLAPSVHAGSYGDNLIVLLDDATKLKSVLQVLTTAVQNICGPDVISELTSRTQIVDPRDGFDFCGLRYSLRKGSLRIWLPVLHMDRFSIRTKLRIQTAFETKDLQAVGKIGKSITGWARHHILIPGVLEEAFSLHATLSKVADAVTKAHAHDDPSKPGGVGE